MRQLANFTRRDVNRAQLLGRLDPLVEKDRLCVFRPPSNRHVAIEVRADLPEHSATIRQLSHIDLVQVHELEIVRGAERDVSPIGREAHRPLGDVLVGR